MKKEHPNTSTPSSNTVITLIKALVLVLAICSCNVSKSFVGNIEDIKGDTVCLPKQCFLLLPNAPKTEIGKRAVFTQTRNRKKINCKIIH